ncbi:MAG: NDP-sugar synthase [Dehalococcoides mccartyi]|uniref:NDP-sugar synthase n=1 Tax=Dehalococcoides mccartyi TaxID=61435 RepID=UPI0030FAB228
MKAIILVGGQGTRLRPLSINTPKSMVPVLNVPFLSHVLRYLSSYGIKDIILTQGHLATPIEQYFGNGQSLGVNLVYSVEHEALGTAGAIKNAERYLDDTFITLNGDIFTHLDLSAMLRAHRDKKALVSIALTPVDDPTKYGLVETADGGRVSRFLEKPSPAQITTNMINAGTYIIEPEVLKYIPAGENHSFERQLFPRLLNECQAVYAYPSSAYWIDIGSPEKYSQLNRDLLCGEGGDFGFSRGNEIVIGRGCQLHPTARISGPVLVGENCIIGANACIAGPVVIGAECRIEDEATLTESVIWQNVTIGAECKVVSSIIANHCHLKAGGKYENVVLGDNVTAECGCAPEPGSKISPGILMI